MIVLGLTGSIGMGKSEAAKSFVQQGVAVFDSDATVHQLFKTNEKLIAEIKDKFPAAVKNDIVDRARLGADVFGNVEKTKQLEALVHPLVISEQQVFLNKHKALNSSIVVFDIPLLFETGADKRVDKTLVISAPRQVQEERVLKRPDMTQEKFEAILGQQMPDKDKCARADYIIKSDGGIEAMQKDIKALIGQLLVEAE